MPPAPVTSTAPVFEGNGPMPMAQEEHSGPIPIKGNKPALGDERTPCFGPWMMAKKSTKKRPGKTPNLGAQLQDSGSRFVAFNGEQEANETKQSAQEMTKQETIQSGSIKPSQGPVKKPGKSNQRGKATGAGNTKKREPSSSTEKENISPNELGKAGIGLELKKPTSKTSNEEKIWLDALKEVQINLWTKFKADKEPDGESHDKPYAPSEEDLQKLLTLLEKKGVTGPTNRDKLGESSLCDDMVMETALGPSN